VLIIRDHFAREADSRIVVLTPAVPWRCGWMSRDSI
jgi:hypothetical protein